MFTFAHFYTFPFNLIVDPASLNKPVIFENGDMKIRINSPYKSYPYNHDFSSKPHYYVNSKGAKAHLPASGGCGVYPMYDEAMRHVGMLVQQNPVYSFDNCMKVKLKDTFEVPDSFPYKPVDTLRFDTNKRFSDDTPKFLSDLFSHLRILSGQFWVGKPRIESAGVSVEAEISFNETLGKFSFHSNLIPIIRYNNGVPITFDIWQRAIQNTINKVDINLDKSLYLDAIYDSTVVNYRSVVLNLANCLDISINVLFKRICLRRTDNSFDRHVFVTENRPHKKVSSTYIPGLVGEFLNSLINKSYQNDSPANYEVIKDFWLNNRNTVAHGGDVSFAGDELAKLFEATDDLMNWLSNIGDDY